MWFEPAVVIEIIGAELTLGPIHTCAIDVIRKESGLAIRVSRFAETICWTSQLKKASGQPKKNDGTLKYYLYLAA